MSIKVALKLNFTFICSVRNRSCHLKKLNFRHFLLSILKNCSRRMKHKKKMSLVAQKIGQTFSNSIKKINYLFPIVQELTLVKNDDR
jgi:hypothetical protein